MINLWNKLLKKSVDFFLDHINWCHETNSKGEKKEPTWFFNLWCLTFWPIPWMDNPCWCCASVRGVIYGIIIGIIGTRVWEFYI